MTGTLTLSGPAPMVPPHIVVKLLSTKPEVASPPHEVVMHGGVLTRDFTITTNSVQEDTEVVISAYFAGMTTAPPLTVTK